MKLSTLSRFIFYITSGLILFSLGFTVYFLYNDFYKAITQAEVIYILRSEVSFEVVNAPLWQKIKNNLDIKQTPTIANTTDIQNPFMIKITPTEEMEE